MCKRLAHSRCFAASAFLVMVCVASQGVHAALKGWDFFDQCLAPLTDVELTVFSCDVAIKMQQRFSGQSARSNEQDQRLAGLLLAKSDALFFRGDIAESVTGYRSAIALNDWRASAYAGLGRSLYIKGDDPRALKALHRAIALFPRFGLAYRYKGLIALRRGHIPAAIADLSVAIDTQPGVAENYVLLGMAYFMGGLNEKAQESFLNAENRLLAWDYLPIWHYLTSPRDAKSQRRLTESIEDSDGEWPSTLASALIDNDAMKTLVDQLAQTRSDDRVTDEALTAAQQSAAIFYVRLFIHTKRNELLGGDSLVNSLENVIAADSTQQAVALDADAVGLTIEEQLLPAVLSGVLPTTTSQ